MHRSDQIAAKIRQRMQELDKAGRWCIMINADPDAMASALALKRILLHRVHSADILHINEITRPDNLAMVRYLRIPLKFWDGETIPQQYTHFALLDSQPKHNKAFENIPFSLIIDHHPLAPDCDCVKENTAICHIRPDIGATSTIMTHILLALHIRPTARLATALLYGIRTDTAAFERSGGELDFRAYQRLSGHADNNLLRRILHSEYLRGWLPIFGRAFRTLTNCRGSGAYVALGNVHSADMLVAIADFFTRVHGLRWIAVSGVVDKTAIVIFRGDGSRDIGRLADACFHDVGSAGGHYNLARAEFPLASVPDDIKPADFILQRLQTRKLRPAKSTPA